MCFYSSTATKPMTVLGAAVEGLAQVLTSQWQCAACSASLTNEALSTLPAAPGPPPANGLYWSATSKHYEMKRNWSQNKTSAELTGKPSCLDDGCCTQTEWCPYCNMLLHISVHRNTDTNNCTWCVCFRKLNMNVMYGMISEYIGGWKICNNRQKIEWILISIPSNEHLVRKPKLIKEWKWEVPFQPSEKCENSS